MNRLRHEDPFQVARWRQKFNQALTANNSAGGSRASKRRWHRVIRVMGARLGYKVCCAKFWEAGFVYVPYMPLLIGPCYFPTRYEERWVDAAVLNKLIWR